MVINYVAEKSKRAADEKLIINELGLKFCRTTTMQKFTQSVHVGSPVQPLVPPGINVMQSDANNAARQLILRGVIMRPTIVGSRLTFDLELTPRLRPLL